VLHVSNTTKDDYGRYRCVASNELGSDSLIIELDGTSQYQRLVLSLLTCSFLSKTSLRNGKD